MTVNRSKDEGTKSGLRKGEGYLLKRVKTKHENIYLWKLILKLVSIEED